MTKNDIINLTEQVCEAWELPVPVIMFRYESIMKDVMAFVLMEGKVVHGIDIVHNVVCFNDYLLSCNINFILDVIYHEIAHLITKATDSDIEFEMFCKLNGIPLSELQDFNLGIDNRSPA